MARETSFYLDFLIADAEPDQAERLLKIALDAVPVASVLLRGDGTTDVRRLAVLARDRGIAVLWGGTPRQAKDLGCDGLHLSWSDDIVQRFKDARRDAFDGAIVGADAGRTRHDAMELGEAGADYVAFGIPPHVDDRARAAERRLDLVGWWSELFEIPCVAFDVTEAANAAALAEAGADFISMTLSSDTDPADAQRLLRSFGEAIGLYERAQ